MIPAFYNSVILRRTDKVRRRISSDALSRKTSIGPARLPAKSRLHVAQPQCFHPFFSASSVTSVLKSHRQMRSKPVLSSWSLLCENFFHSYVREPVALLPTPQTSLRRSPSSHVRLSHLLADPGKQALDRPRGI